MHGERSSHSLMTMTGFILSTLPRRWPRCRATEARVAYSGVEVIERLENTPPVRRWIYHSRYDSVALLCENEFLSEASFRVKPIDQVCRSTTFPIYQDRDLPIQLSRRTRFLRFRHKRLYRWPPGSGVNDPGRTGDAHKRVFAKWRPALSAGDYTAVIGGRSSTPRERCRPAQYQLLDRS